MKPKRILIVDDDEDMLKEISGFLMRYGGKIEIITASNGVEAMAIIAKTDGIDLVITDFHMPMADGIEVYEFAQKASSKVKIIIVMSGMPYFLENLARQNRYVPPADRVLEKPFTLDQLERKIESLIAA